MKSLRPLRAELPALWSDISNAMRGFKNHSLHMLVLDEVLGLELSNFSRQLKLKPGIDDDHRVIVAMSNGLWFRGKEIKEAGGRRKNSKETRAHLEARVLRTEPEANQWLHLTPRVAALGRGCFRARPSDDQEDPCLLSERGKPGRECWREISRVREQSVPTYRGSFLDPEGEGRRRL